MEKGQKVKFKGDVTIEQIKWGNHTDPEGILEKDKIYTIKDIDIHSWHTRIYLGGISGYFNSVWFEAV